MAEILTHKIEFIENNLFGTYVAGDVISVYLEQTALVSNTNIYGFATTGVVTYLNGSPLASGGFIDLSPGRTAIQNYNTQICLTTELVVPQIYTLWPYGYYYTEADHYSCAVASATCDLLITGPAVIVPATASDQADGSITINATSTNAIEYSLDQITWQSSSTFSALLPSSYRVYVRDSKNCKGNILVEVSYSNSYGAIYRLEYDNGFNSSVTKLDITKRGYSGAVTEICGGTDPFSLQLRGDSSDKFQALISTQGNLNLTSETDQFFLELYTNDPNLYRLNYYKDSVLKWTGKILPFIYSEDYKSPPYYVTVTATDGLAELKDFYLLQKDGSRMFGKMKLIKIIAYCLGKLNLDLGIRVACNMYATGMASTAADDPLDQAYVDLECFYIAQKEASLDFVIKSILDPFGCRIIQWEEKWHIIRMEEMVTTYTWRQYDSGGVYVSNGSTNPVVDINYPTVGTVMFTGTPSLEIQHGFGTIKTDYSLGLKNNLLDNGDFRLQYQYTPGINGVGGYYPLLNKQGWNLFLSDYPLFDNYEVFEEGNIAWSLSNDYQILVSQNAGAAFIESAPYNVKMGINNTLKFKIRYNIARSELSPMLLPIGVTFPYIKVRLMVKYGSYYLTNSGYWTTTESTIDFLETKLNEFVEREITAFSPSEGTPALGMDLTVRLYHASQYYTQFKTLTALRAFVTQGQYTFAVTTATAAYGATYTNNSQTFTVLATVSGSASLVCYGTGAPAASGTLTKTSGDGDATITFLSFLRSGYPDNITLPTGYKTELRDVFTYNTSAMRYYELEETTEAESGYDIVRPNDYNATNNPRAWVQKFGRGVYSLENEKITFKIDRIEMKYLVEGKEPVDSITRAIQAERLNRQVLTKEFIIGSSADVITTGLNVVYFNTYSWVDYWLMQDSSATVVTMNILSSDLLYTGWLRSSSNVAYDTWTRDGVAETDKLHNVWMKSAASQYNKSWRLLRAGLVSRNTLFSPLNSYKEVNDSNRIYLPMNGTLSDFENIFSLELCEIGFGDASEVGSDGTITAPYTSAFTTGFGSDYN